jgi:M6 family metalloprotease-like protein
MNMKKSLFAIVFLTLLAGCASIEGSVSSSETSLPAVYTPTAYDLDYQTLRRAQGYKSATPTEGTVPILVIPVTFPDYPCSALTGGCAGVRSDIETAFFGEASETGWHSIRSFYDLSSYGRLQFEGEVSDWYTASLPAVDLLDRSQHSVVSEIMRPAVTWYREHYDDDLTRFDSDGDGFLDALYFIYSVPAHEHDELFLDDDRVFWAYTSFDNAGQSDVNRPGVFHYGWSSYDFMYKDGYYDRDEQGRLLRDEDDEPVFHPWTDEFGKILIDAHTYIHEFGHFFGLVDYYSYDADSGDWGPCGALDMMDYNVGDHGAFSKTLLGWLHPRVINDEATIALTPSIDGPDAAIVPINYDDRLVDEYLLIEYYRPISLNQKDSSQPFAGYYPRQFSQAGIKIYHVDARPGRFVQTGGRWLFQDYVDHVRDQTSTVYYGLANSNSAGRSGVPYHKLIQLLTPSGRDSFKHGYVATNQDLFQAGTAFDETNYPGFTFNGGEPFPYTISIDALSEEAVTITVARRAV